MCVLDTDKQIMGVWEIEIDPKQKIRCNTFVIFISKFSEYAEVDIENDIPHISNHIHKISHWKRSIY